MPADVLPTPDANAQEHSQRVVAAVCKRIAENGAIAFGEYMQMALYANGLGYYVSGNEVLGAAGDFVTAPLVSPLFGSCVAQQCAQSLGVSGGDVLEFGAGNGALAASVLLALAANQSLPDRYLILEPSAVLAKQQQATLQAAVPDSVLQRVTWVSEVPASFVGVVLANEVLDAMPVERFIVGEHQDSVLQIYVDCDQNGLHYVQQPASAAVTRAAIALQQSLGSPLPEGYCSEVSLLLGPWLQSLADSVQRGLILLIDYGYPRKEYYIQERTQGTLRCYYRHRMHEDALRYPGLQDITSDVDFTRVAEEAHNAGFDLHGFTNQAQFLIGNGLTDHADLINTERSTDRYNVAQQVKNLSMGSGMGDRFQVMALSKSLDVELDGFRLAEFSHRL